MLQYHILSIWWPEGWEPRGPSDVPNCAWQTELEPLEPLPLARPMGREEALGTVRALNRQVIDSAADRWYLVAAVESESPPSESGQETCRVSIVRPESDSGRGDCTACPGHDLECATADWRDEACVLRVRRVTG